jgi:diguanylate cyclase (GGDEF)-like protein/PAS domain S-box-containing protein
MAMAWERTPARAKPGIDPLRLVEAWPGPALLVDDGGNVVAANAAAAPVEAAFDQGGPLSLVAAEIAEGGPADRRIVRGRGHDGPVVWEMTIAGCAPGLALAAGRDATLERRLVEALGRSREMYRDLVACSADFAWETDASGAFTFVSERGALGWSAADLFGTSARRLLDPERNPPGHDPFSSLVPLDEDEVWLRGRDGVLACVLVSCVPVGDGDEDWRGCRGVARDVTEERRRAATLERALARERLLDTVTDAMASAVDPNEAIHVAAEATRAACGADALVILGAAPGGHMERAAQAGPDEPGLATQTIADLLAEGARIRCDSVGGRNRVMAAVWHQGHLKGAIAILRSGPSWSVDEMHLVEGVARQLGIAFAQVEHVALLERISRTDPLTGLLNRRAFDAELARRVAHGERTGRAGALVFVDLDNFKQVNDRLGHAGGDAVLVDIGRLLTDGLRAADLAVRFGGDEFGLWLEETDEAGATRVAERLLAAMAPLNARVWNDMNCTQALGLSIGIAVHEPLRGETCEELVARADAAMYETKQGGKNGCRVAPAYEERT